MGIFFTRIEPHDQLVLDKWIAELRDQYSPRPELYEIDQSGARMIKTGGAHRSPNNGGRCRTARREDEWR